MPIYLPYKTIDFRNEFIFYIKITNNFTYTNNTKDFTNTNNSNSSQIHNQYTKLLPHKTNISPKASPNYQQIVPKTKFASFCIFPLLHFAFCILFDKWYIRCRRSIPANKNKSARAYIESFRLVNQRMCMKTPFVFNQLKISGV